MANNELIKGVDTFLLYGVESTFNTAVAAVTHLGLVTNFTPNINRQVQENRGFKGTTTCGQEVAKYTLGQLSCTET